ncbi:MAG: hypothetical protein HWE22_10565 [Flavobacteriales bacterium]|nr:hypothetical protein [Flavobacteriales bacterium]
MKHFIIPFFLLLAFSSQGQNFGVIMVKAYKNTTLNLDDNIEVDSITVRVVHRKTQAERTIVFYKGQQRRPLFKPGVYTLTCSVEGEKDWVIKRVRLKADAFAFVGLLYEPEGKLSSSQKQKRNEQGFTYER